MAHVSGSYWPALIGCAVLIAWSIGLPLLACIGVRCPPWKFSIDARLGRRWLDRYGLRLWRRECACVADIFQAAREARYFPCKVKYGIRLLTWWKRRRGIYIPSYSPATILNRINVIEHDDSVEFVRFVSLPAAGGIAMRFDETLILGLGKFVSALPHVRVDAATHEWMHVVQDCVDGIFEARRFGRLSLTQVIGYEAHAFLTTTPARFLAIVAMLAGALIVLITQTMLLAYDSLF